MRFSNVLFAAVTLAQGQQPYTLLPRNYKLELENESVRVSRAQYFPGDRIPEHTHPTNPTVYVYLSDGGAIRFLHKTPTFEANRPAVKKGSVRFNRNAQDETHEIEYLGTSPAETLRIELKTKPGPPHQDARLNTDADFPWEDPQIRISRFRGIPPGITRTGVLVNIDKGSVRWVTPGARIDEIGWFVLIELRDAMRIAGNE